MATEICTSLTQQFTDAGAVLNGGTVGVYDVTTTTLKTVYSDTGLSVSVTNPIPLDSAGCHDMRYIATGSYKLIWKNSSAAIVRTRDNIDGRVPVGTGALAIANGGTSATTAAAALSALGGVTAAQLAATDATVASLAGTLSATDKTHLATGTTAQRASSPIEGDVRRNTTTSLFEGYNGTAWVPVITGSADISTLVPTVQRFTSGVTQTYTKPTGCVRIRVRMVGPGGGGGAQVTNAGSAGSADTLFAVWTAVKGSGGPAGGAGTTGGAGGTGGTDSTGTKIRRLDGARGGASCGGATSVLQGPGGGTGLGPATQCAPSTSTGNAGAANTGAGGAGGGTNGTNAGGGGGGGEYVEFWITSPSATYTYTVGSGGAGGSAGTTAGGAGAAGVIEVEEFYY